MPTFNASRISLRAPNILTSSLHWIGSCALASAVLICLPATAQDTSLGISGTTEETRPEPPQASPSAAGVLSAGSEANRDSNSSDNKAPEVEMMPIVAAPRAVGSPQSGQSSSANLPTSSASVAFESAASSVVAESVSAASPSNIGSSIIASSGAAPALSTLSAISNSGYSTSVASASEHSGPAPKDSAEALLSDPRVRTNDYPVRGKNFQEISKDLDLFSASTGGSSHSDFGFLWNMSWSYTVDPDSKVPQAKIAVSYQIELPAWADRPADSQHADAQRWDSYRLALLRALDSRIRLVDTFLPRIESDLQNFLLQNSRARQGDIDDYFRKSLRTVRQRLDALNASEASQVPRRILIGIGAR